MDLSSKPDYMIFVFINHLWLILLLPFYLNKHFDFSLLLVFIQIKLNPSCLWTFCQSIQPPYSMGAYCISPIKSPNHSIFNTKLHQTQIQKIVDQYNTFKNAWARNIQFDGSTESLSQIWVKTKPKNRVIVTYSVSRQKCVFVPFTWLNYYNFQKVRVSPFMVWLNVEY